MSTNIIVMMFYFIITLTVGVYFGRKKTGKSADFTVGGRALGGVIIFFTMLATIVGASSVMGYSNWFARRGLSQFWFTIGITITNLLYLFYLGPRINEFGRKHGGETIGDWFLFRYGTVSKYLASLLIAAVSTRAMVKDMPVVMFRMVAIARY